MLLLFHSQIYIPMPFPILDQGIMHISGMPEAPDLEVVKNYLNAELKDAVVESCKVLRPTVVRSLATEVSCDLPGRTFLDAQRRGKFLTLRLSGGRSLVINPMLTGALQHCDDSVRVLKKTCVNLSLAGGMNLRYLDDRQMGKVYYIINGGDNDEARGDSQEELIPQYTGLGPDVLSGITLQEFETRLKKFNGEIKAVLTRGHLSPALATPTLTRFSSPPEYPLSKNAGR
jgi:formamidopyrimidine-DNA glycosylase